MHSQKEPACLIQNVKSGNTPEQVALPNGFRYFPFPLAHFQLSFLLLQKGAE